MNVLLISGNLCFWRVLRTHHASHGSMLRMNAVSCRYASYGIFRPLYTANSEPRHPCSRTRAEDNNSCSVTCFLQKLSSHPFTLCTDKSICGLECTLAWPEQAPFFFHWNHAQWLDGLFCVIDMCCCFILFFGRSFMLVCKHSVWLPGLGHHTVN